MRETNPFLEQALHQEQPKELQELFDKFFVRYISALNCYADCKADEAAADKALQKLVSFLCAQKGLPADKLEEDRIDYIIYLSADRTREKSVAVAFEMSEYDENAGEIVFTLEARYRPESAQDWREEFKLKASPQAMEKFRAIREEKKRKGEAEEKERKIEYEKYLPGALSFMREHGNGVVKSDDLGTLEPMLRNYFRWDLGSEDSIRIALDEDNSEWVIKLLHPNGSVYDVIAISDKI